MSEPASMTTFQDVWNKCFEHVKIRKFKAVDGIYDFNLYAIIVFIYCLLFISFIKYYLFIYVFIYLLTRL
jgi:hypothetical protein